jgi:hypothetical protein
MMTHTPRGSEKEEYDFEGLKLLFEECEKFFVDGTANVPEKAEITEIWSARGNIE